MRSFPWMFCVPLLVLACDSGDVGLGDEGAPPTDAPATEDVGSTAEVAPADAPGDARPDLPADIAPDLPTDLVGDAPAEVADPGTDVAAQCPDENGDEQPDCFAPACWTLPACGRCTASGTLGCGDRATGDSSSGPSVLEAYFCREPGQDPFDLSGAEGIYAFTSGTGVRVRVTHEAAWGPMAGFAQAMVLEGACHEAACLGATQIAAAGESTSLAFAATAGTPYFIVADSSPPGGTFELAVDCFEDPWCGDGADNDGDGPTDCDDADCGETFPCIERPECGDGQDDDEDGLTDCDDPDCAGAAGCFCIGATPVVACDTILQGDLSDREGLRTGYACGLGTFGGAESVYAFTAPASGDVQAVFQSRFYTGRLVLLDAACDPDDGESCLAATQSSDTRVALTFAAQQGAAYRVVVETLGDYEVSFVCRRAEDCEDGLDNDLDGSADCHDTDCRNPGEDPATWFPGCRAEAACNDRQDNDGDGAVDCEDADCDGKVGFPGGQFCEWPAERSCHDGVDNNAMAGADCWDGACWDECIETGTECGDGEDNDADLLTDCDDLDCATDLHCTERDCDDGLDGPDADGLVDCDDPDCACG